MGDKYIGLVKKFYDETGIEQISIVEVMHMVEFAKWLEQYAVQPLRAADETKEQKEVFSASIIVLARCCANLSKIEEITRDVDVDMNAFVINRFEEIWDYASKNWGNIKFYCLVDAEIKKLD